MAKNLKFNVVKFSENVTNTIDKTKAGIGKVLSAPQTLTEQLNKKTGLNIALPSVPPINQNLRGLVSSTKELAKNPGGVVKGGISAATSFAKTQLTGAGISLLTDKINSITKTTTPPSNNTAGSNGGIGSINLKNGITNAIDTNISSVANNLGGSVSGAINGTVSGVINNAPDSLSSASKNIRTSLGGVINNNISNVVTNTTGGISGVVTNSVGGIVQGGVSGVAGSVGGIAQGGVTSVSSSANKFAKAQFGNLTATVTGNLTQLKSTLRGGIKNCLRSSITGLARSIAVPNLPFGGISLNSQDLKTPDIRVAASGVINSQVQAGTVAISKKFNKFLSAEITLQGAIQNKKLNIASNVNVRFNVLKNVKSTNFYTAKLTSEVNKNINNICNTLTPRNKKALAKGGPLMDIVANAASDVVINNVEDKIVKAASGFSVKAPSDFFNKTTGKVNATIDKATGLVDIAGEKAGSAVTSTATSVQSGVTKTYNNIKDAISSNVAKLKG